MKIKPKKLELDKVVVQKLTSYQLNKVVGGNDPIPPSSRDYSSDCKGEDEVDAAP